MITILFSLAMTSAQAITGLPYMDSQFECISQEQATKYQRDFDIDIRSFGGLELCDGSVDTKKLFNDLQIIEQGVFRADQDHLLIKGFVPSTNYYGWMKSQTRGIERGNDIPYATAYNSGGYFTMQDGWAHLSTLGRVGTIIHEARHTAGYSHTRCDQGPYAGVMVSGCDNDYDEGGSHGVEMEYYARVSVLGENFHPVYRAMARLMAMGRSNFVFNESPIQKREALLLENTLGSFELHDADQVYTREALGEGVLKRTSFGASLFDGLKAYAVEMYEFLQSPVALDDGYSYYKLIKEDRGQGTAALQDFEEFDSGVKRYVVGLTADSRSASYNFGAGKFNTFRKTPAAFTHFQTTSPEGKNGLFAVTAEGKVYQFQTNSDAWAALNQQWADNIVKMLTYKNQVLRLTDAGTVEVLEKGQWVPAPEFVDKTFQQMVAVPLYNGFDVQ